MKQYIHLADNQNLEQGNNVTKLKSIYDAFNQILKQFDTLNSKSLFDESVVSYKSLHSSILL